MKLCLWGLQVLGWVSCPHVLGCDEGRVWLCGVLYSGIHCWWKLCRGWGWWWCLVIVWMIKGCGSSGHITTGSSVGFEFMVSLNITLFFLPGILEWVTTWLVICLMICFAICFAVHFVVCLVIHFVIHFVICYAVGWWSAWQSTLWSTLWSWNDEPSWHISFKWTLFLL